MANKVLFGISNLHVGTYTETTTTEGTTIALGTPYHQRGAVSMSPTESNEKSDFYADDILYYSSFTGGTFEGEIEVAMFDDEFKKNFLGYVTLTNGGLAIKKNATKPKTYVCFEVQGDVEARRVIFYNVEFGAITRSYTTITETKEPQTETIAFTAIGDNNTGVTMATLKPTDTGYNTLFTAPAAPAIATN